MNREEKIAESYLFNLGFQNIVYEPDGNIPPDFVADKNTAVEVRRLNENYFEENGFVKGLETDFYKLKNSLEPVFRSFDSLYNGKSCVVTLHFKRPIGNIRNVQNILNVKLRTFLASNQKLPTSIIITENIDIRLVQCSPQHGKIFCFNVPADRDRGGWLLPNLSENLKYCIEEKTEKIKDYHSKYKRWWLIFIDQISYGLDDIQKAYLKKTVKKGLYWDKIILLNTMNGNEIFKF